MGAKTLNPRLYQDGSTLFYRDNAASATGGFRGVADRVVITHRQASGVTDAATIFIADRAYYVEAINEAHSTAGNDAGAVTATVKKMSGTDALAAGTDLASSDSFDLKGPANTVQALTLGTAAVRTLAAGDRLGLDVTGTTTALADVCVTVVLRPV